MAVTSRLSKILTGGWPLATRCQRQTGRKEAREKLEVWKPVRIMLAMHSVPLSKLVLPTKSRGSGLVECTQKDGCSLPQTLTPPTTAQNSAAQTWFFGLRKESSKWAVIETLFIIAIIRKQSPHPELPLTGRINYDAPIQWDTLIPLSQNCVTCYSYLQKSLGMKIVLVEDITILNKIRVVFIRKKNGYS